MRLLLVEDDAMIGEAVLDLLRAEQYAVDWVRDGVMADTATLTQTYDLILLDLGLPRRDGLAVLQDWRARKLRTPVLIATARDSVAQRVQGLDAGHWLMRQQPEVFNRAVRQWLDEARSAAGGDA